MEGRSGRRVPLLLCARSAVSPPPQLDRRPDGGIRFRALAGLMGGRRFALHDVDRSTGRIQKVALESAEATHRIFIQADGGRWTYAFTPGEGRGLAAPALERQLQAAKYSTASGDPR